MTDDITTETPGASPGSSAVTKPFPLYKMIAAGKSTWLRMGDAGRLYDCGWIDVRIGGTVLDGEGEERPITDAERQQIVDIADEWSANK